MNTVDKNVIANTITGLTPGTDYYFVLRTWTDPHANNDNKVTSDYSDEATAKTTGISPAGFTVSAISGDTGEDGTPATFTVNLTSEPVGDVAVDVKSSDTTEGTVDKSALIFNSISWAGLQMVTVTGADDYVADGNIPYTVQLVVNTTDTTDSDYDPLNPPDVSVTNVDDETAGFTVSSITQDTAEDLTQGTFTVKLTSEPVGIVAVDVASSDITEGTVDKSALTYDNTDWNINQTVTVTGVNDYVADGDIPYTIQLVVNTTDTTDSDYDPLNPADVAVTNLDFGETAGFSVSAITQDTGEDLTQGTFTVKLTSEPVGVVVVNVTSSDTTEGTVDKSSLTYDNTDWNINQTVTVTGVDDSANDGDIAYTIQLIVNTTDTTDPAYDPLNPADVSVINLDDDGGGGGGAAAGGGGGCFIATAAYGSYSESHVMVLRKFRDNVLFMSAAGTALVEMYYSYSPPVANYIASHGALRTATRIALAPVVGAVKHPGVALISMGLLMGFVVAGAGESLRRRRRK